MGQDWILANLDKRQMANWGQRADFWGGSVAFLDTFLCRRPVYLADLEDVRLPASPEKIKLPPRATACANEWSSVTIQNKRKLSDGTHSDCDDRESHLSKRAKQASGADRPSLTSNYSDAAPLNIIPYLSLLPAELIDRIYTHLSDHIEVVFFALTSRRHWQVGRRHIHFRFECLSSWAGDRLICIGNYSEDLPPGLLTAAEETELRKGFTRAEKLEHLDIESEESDEDDGKTRRLSLYDLAVHRFTPRIRGSEVEWVVYNELLCRPPYTTASRNDSELFLSLTNPGRAWKRHGVHLQTSEPEPIGLRKRWNVHVGRPEPEHAEHWAVLRNLSRREYVHGKAVQELRERDDQDDSGWASNDLDLFGFGELIALRSFWSQSNGNSPFGWDWNRGIWAGNRFDIVLERDLKKAMENEEWTDVTEEALAEVFEVS